MFVTHGGTIGDLLRTLFPCNELPIIHNKKTGAKYIEILPGSVTVLEKEEGSYRLVRMNETTQPEK